MSKQTAAAPRRRRRTKPLGEIARRILSNLARGPATSGDLADRLEISQQHIGVTLLRLERSGRIYAVRSDVPFRWRLADQREATDVSTPRLGQTSQAAERPIPMALLEDDARLCPERDAAYVAACLRQGGFQARVLVDGRPIDIDHQGRPWRHLQRA